MAVSGISKLLRWLRRGLGAALLGACGAFAQAPPDPLPLSWCLERAAATSPALDVARFAAEAAEQRVYPAGALPDPRYRYELSNLPIGDFGLGSTPLTGHQFGLSMRLPFPGARSSRREAARAAADAALETLDDQSLQIAAAVERAWVELGFAQRALEITDESIDLLRQFAKIAEAKYRVGEGLQQSVIRAQVALAELIDERLGREAAIRAAEARLASLLDLPAERPFPQTAAAPEQAPLPDLAALLGRLESSSPLLRALAERIEASRHELRTAQLGRYPDFDLGLGYRVRDKAPGDPVGGDDFLSASVSVQFPIDRRKWRAQVAERRALVHRGEAEYRQARAELRQALGTRHAQLTRADQAIALLQDGLLPQARQSLESTRAGYAVNKLSFLDLIDSQVRLLNAQLRLERAIADRRIAFAAIEASLGASLR